MKHEEIRERYPDDNEQALWMAFPASREELVRIMLLDMRALLTVIDEQQREIDGHKGHIAELNGGLEDFTSNMGSANGSHPDANYRNGVILGFGQAVDVAGQLAWKIIEDAIVSWEEPSLGDTGEKMDECGKDCDCRNCNPRLHDYAGTDE